ncbi:hypothetical protein [Oricola sp.]|uniref:hypothetical protein n=1 Tax=Oricola sp. TaxID=1979950 RepID=UPI0025F5D678|nr:hypothetical protein [Oricola sp.]MCI5075820.1 hypothetical protein [Oricola sp.]
MQIDGPQAVSAAVAPVLAPGEIGVAETRLTDQDRLEYVGKMLAELRRLANAERHPTLTYFIDMAYLEAMDLANENERSGRGGDERDAVA